MSSLVVDARWRGPVQRFDVRPAVGDKIITPVVEDPSSRRRVAARVIPEVLKDRQIQDRHRLAVQRRVRPEHRPNVQVAEKLNDAGRPIGDPAPRLEVSLMAVDLSHIPDVALDTRSGQLIGR